VTFDAEMMSRTYGVADGGDLGRPRADRDQDDGAGPVPEPGVDDGGQVAGPGCLPKDIHAFRTTATNMGVDSVARLLGEVDDINRARRHRVVNLTRDAVGGSLAGKRVAALGVAFKPNSDDIRDSPSLDVCGRLIEEGAIVSVHDPVAMTNAARVKPELRYAPTVSEAAEAAELVLHLTEWADYRAIDPAALAAVVDQPVLIDARCALDTELWLAAGWRVRVLGRPQAGTRGAR
jgi:UDPglucose 6-dehydrogenase